MDSSVQRDIEQLMDLSTKLDVDRGHDGIQLQLIEKAEFSLHEAEFKKKSISINVCTVCVACWSVCMERCVGLGYNISDMGSSLWGNIQAMFSKKLLFDNVLADTENAFQTLAKLMTYLVDLEEQSWGIVYYICCGVWKDVLGWLLSYIIVCSSTITLILPSFFTLLIVRTSTVEKESTAFGGK